MREIYTKLSELLANNERGVLVTITEVAGSSPRHTGSKMIVRPDGEIYGTIGGGKLEAQAIDEASRMLNNGLALIPVEKKTYTLNENEGMLCGGQAEVIFEPFGNKDQMVIFGGGHIGHALAPLGKKAGFWVSVMDNRPEYANRERFPDVDDVMADEYGILLKQVTYHENLYVVIVTHGHTHDEEVLEYSIQQPHAYIGMIGSNNKSRTVLRHLEEKGIPGDLLDQVHSPVGINIGAESPFEIAISILSEVIAVRQGVDVGSLSMALKS
ncbi:MAG TPA: XdhC family protein [bacterium]|nr:XdhC family protein [bacterium]